MTQIDIAKYKPIPNYSRYLVSEDGEVWDTKRCRNINCDNKGLVRLVAQSGVKYLQLRNVVYSLFVGMVTSSDKVINKDGNKRNNSVENILLQPRDSSVMDGHIVYPSNINRANLLSRHRSMMYRCYNNSSYNEDKFSMYGGKGVEVSGEWKEYKNYAEWFVSNYIDGWVIDKDILPVFAGNKPMYSSANCVFIPEKMNAFFSSITRGYEGKIHTVRRKHIKYEAAITINGEPKHLSGDTEEDVLEQYYLIKDLHLEKLVFEMKEDHRRVIRKYPQTPEISQRLLAVLDKFSTEKYLALLYRA